jgi:hypothetical protein
MVSSPISLFPVRAAGLNLGPLDDAGTLLSLDDALQTNCAASPMGGDCTTFTATWGDTQEVQVQFDRSTRRVFYLGLNLGYVGQLQFVSADKSHAYVVAVNRSIELDGKSLTLDWGQPPTAAMVSAVEAMHSALAATFAPSRDEPHCVATGNCKIGAFTDQSGYVYFKTLGFAFRVQSVVAAQPTPSVVNFIDLYATP